MKKHDRIFVPHDSKTDGVSFDDNWHVSHEGFAGPDMKPIEVIPRTDVIVMTLAELEELWDAAKEYGSDMAHAVRTKSANTPKRNMIVYLEEKGITL